MDARIQVIFKIDEYMKQYKKQYKKNCKALTLEPKVIGCFSVSSERFYSSDTNELKFLVIPGPGLFPLNLNKQLVSPDKHQHHAEYLDNMLYFIRDHPDKMVKMSTGLGSVVQADIVTQHELLQTLMRTPYMSRDWRILGTKYRNTIYLCLAKPTNSGRTPADLQKERACQMMETKLKRFLYSDAPDSLSSLRSDGGEFHGVFRCSIGGLSVVYGSAMGAHCNKRIQALNKNSSRFAECKVILPHSDTQSSISKPDPEEALMWWSDCYLKGVKEIYVARPQPSGHVQNLTTCSLTSLISDNINNWSCDMCIEFMHYTLQQICTAMQLENPNSVYHFNYVSNPGVLMFDVNENRNENTFISDWFRFTLDNP
ncbi:protein cutoff-like [Drosophila montana]|uniref:protein cutoff-like n=1 Tax=Drosophila montana TaxID=40370 RepID=UPI00313AB1CA